MRKPTPELRLALITVVLISTLIPMRTGLQRRESILISVKKLVNSFLIYSDDRQNLSCRTRVTCWWIETLEQMELVITFNI
jgi:hypothetical protein